MSLFVELKRRNVFRVGIAYLALAWLITEVVGTLFPGFGVPDWAFRFVVIVLALGFIPVLIFSWAYEITPEGIKREKYVVRDVSITHLTAKRLDGITIGIIAAAVVFILLDRFWLSPRLEDQSTAPPISATEPVVSEPAVSKRSEKSIAVLPFVDMSPARDQEYFTDGLTENLLHALAQIREIKVAGRTSSFSFKGQNLDLRSIGEQLGVQNILEGSVQKAGDRVRITAQLVNAGDGFHLWSEVFDRDLDDIFVVQDEITAAVVRALRQSILGEDEITADYAGDYRAYNAYLLGRSYHNQSTFEGWEKAIEQYRLALEIDPGMALAWSGLSKAISHQTGFGAGPAGLKKGFVEGYERAREAANKAIALNPALPEGYLALAEVLLAYDWDWSGVEQALQSALELRPGDSEIRSTLAELLAIQGEFNAALAQAQQALALDPLNGAVQRLRLWLLVALDRLDEALAGAQQQLQAGPVRGGLGVLLSTIYIERGENARALEAAQRETFPFLRLTMEAIAHDALGDRAAADEKLRQLIDQAGDGASYQVAAIYAKRGDLDRAFEALERGMAIRDPGLTNIQLHNAFDPLRDDPRYGALLKKMGLR